MIIPDIWKKQHVPNHQPESEDGTGSQYKKKTTLK
jgi:hypothetical protein